jgi:hypothetical protein
MTGRIPAVKFTLASTGGADGACNITSNTGAFPGAIGYLAKSDGTLGQRVQITELVSTTSVALRFLAEGMDDPKIRSGVVKVGNLGRSDCSGYASGSILHIPAQDVAVQQPIFDPMPSA